MEDIKYNILWIDDEHEKLSGIKGRAKRNGINLAAFKSLNGGMSELEKNYTFYDGVLLDAKILENDDDQAGTEDTLYIHRAKEQLLQLKKKFEIFVLTGQAEAFDSKIFNDSFKKVYRKGIDKDIEELFYDIKNAADQSEDTQLRHQYKRVFDVCTERYIEEYAGQDLLSMLKIEDESNIDNHFNTIRKIIEDLFSAFHKFNLLPSEFVNRNVALNQSSIFLAGDCQHDKTNDIYKQHRHLDETHLPQQIAYYLKSMLAVTQDGSHRSSIDEHVRTVKTSYLLKSTLFQLMDVLVWFKIYVDSNPKTENWERIESKNTTNETNSVKWISGKVIEREKNKIKGFAFFKPDELGENAFIPIHLVNIYFLKDDMPIKAEIEECKDNRTEELKIRVKRLEIL